MTTIKPHPAYPITDANRLLYLRIRRARLRLARTTDPEIRMAYRHKIGELTQQIRRLGMEAK